MSDSEDEDHVYYGSPLEPLDEGSRCYLSFSLIMTCFANREQFMFISSHKVSEKKWKTR